MIDQRLEYIHLNPVAIGFVDVPEAWVYSSARDYSGMAKGWWSWFIFKAYIA
ncbi:MAG TPA: hypothetical protein VD884_08310 [Ohtaekwangia sp.]|nr:hypothetical protein [Ohtaekwangia sp.]